MSSLLDTEIADAWGRRLEGLADGATATAEEPLAAALRLDSDPDQDFARLLVADESLDRLLRRSLAPPAASEAFVAGVLAAIDLPPLDPPSDVPSDVPSEPPLIRLRTPPARIRPRPILSDGGLLAATIAGLGLAAAVIALAVLEPWNWQAPRPPAPAARQPEPKPEPGPAIQLPPEPPAKPTPEPAPEPPPEPTPPQPSYPQPDYPRPGSSRPDPDAATSGKAVEWTFGGGTSSGTMSGGTQLGGANVSISQQMINGRFQGTITIDGKTQTFDSREAFEEAKRKLGSGTGR